MDNTNTPPIPLNQDLQDAFDAGGWEPPCPDVPADFDGFPVLYWADHLHPNDIPHPPHASYTEMPPIYSGFATNERLLSRILLPIPAALHPTMNTGAPLPAPEQHPSPTLSAPEQRQPTPVFKSLNEIIYDLLSPGFSRTYEGINHQGMATIDLIYVVKCMGASASEHLEYDHEKGRAVLKGESELLSRGREMGMPELYMQWLGGANAEHKLRIPMSTLRAAAGSKEDVARGN